MSTGNSITGFSIGLTTRLSAEMDLLRMISFPARNKQKTSEDEFDMLSFHLTISIDNDIAGYCRLTPGPNSVFHTWTNGLSELPNTTNSIDAGRLLIAPRYRGYNLLPLLLVEICIHCHLLGFKQINGTYIPGHSVIERAIKAAGFNDCGKPLIEHETGGISLEVQPVTCLITDERIHWWIDRKNTLLMVLYKQLYAT